VPSQRRLAVANALAAAIAQKEVGNYAAAIRLEDLLSRILEIHEDLHVPA
jgi:hypothetical protein